MAKLFVIPFITSLTTLNLLNIANYCDDLIGPAVIITSGISLTSFIFKKYTFSIYLTSFAISLLIGHMFLEKREIFYAKKSLDIESEQYLKIRGKVLSFPVIGDSKSTIILRTENIYKKGNVNSSGIVLQININGDLGYLCMGDTVIVDTTIRKSRPSLNFFTPKSESYLLANGIHFSGYSKSALFIERIKNSGILFRTAGWIREK